MFPFYQSIGEQVDEEKRPKGKKFKEKLERPKSQKKDKRKSLEEVENSRGSDKEEENEEEQDAETGVTNFQENFYVLPSSIGTDPSPIWRIFNFFVCREQVFSGGPDERVLPTVKLHQSEEQEEGWQAWEGRGERVRENVTQISR